MSIVEYHGGQVTHRYLMNKSKSDLARLYLELLGLFERERERQQKAKLDGNDIWEALFSITEGDVPEGMTEDVCAKLADWLNYSEETRHG